VLDDQRRVLMIWRHRFITDSWGWEIPIGKIESGEEPIAASAREVEEETGWRPGRLRPLLYTQPTNGISDSVHHIFRADGATHLGPPTEGWESERVGWIPLTGIRPLIDKRDIISGTTLAALLYVLTEA
jgi:8-oxo-dGTP pyrophosphatase MutT (NUDIX family)